MIFDALSEVNWLAVLLASIAWFVFSAVWYSVPPISKPWIRATKVQPGEGPPLPVLLVPTFVAYFLTALVIAILAKAIGARDVVDGIALGVALGVGFGIVPAFIVQLYEQKGAAYWALNGFNAVIAYTIVSVIVTLMD